MNDIKSLESCITSGSLGEGLELRGSNEITMILCCS